MKEEKKRKTRGKIVLAVATHSLHTAQLANTQILWTGQSSFKLKVKSKTMLSINIYFEQNSGATSTNSLSLKHE